ncbi:hypothetical protein Zmor_000121 [Zophobas morio]|uniref:Gustatory receptor n=1 Tax=Zophobas morio TaxID=2755281 RepID=A0AA38J0V9_9CUCU|nr:hypothetical protein Zmor_000121 [Zophobas morio]
MESTDWGYINPLYLWCTTFGIFPPHKFGDNVSPVSLKFKIYVLLLIPTIISISVYSLIGRENFLYTSLDVTVATTDLLAEITLTLLNVVLRLLFVFCYHNPIKTFLNKIYRISKEPHFKCYTVRNFWVQFCGFNIYMVFVMVFDVYIWSSTMGWTIYKFYIGRTFMIYACNITLLFIVHSALITKQLFTSLHHLLKTIVGNLVCENDAKSGYILTEFKVKAATKTNYNCCHLREVRKYYNEICGLVDDFNNIYGTVILLVMIYVIAYILNLTDMLLVYSNAKSRNINGVEYGTELTLLCVSWMITLLLFSFLLAKSCSNAVSESENILTVCFIWLNEIPTIPKTFKQQMLKEEILLLVQQVTTRKPKFSAAGFFPVDFTLLGFILGSVTSYTIVSVQFFSSKEN